MVCVRDLSIRLYVRLEQMWREQRGSGIIDYVAVGFVVLAMMAALAAGMSGKGGSLAQAVVDKIGGLIDNIK
jgi:hypothetical protein